MDDYQRTMLAERNDLMIDHDPRWGQLRQRLLDIGGDEVVPRGGEPHLWHLLQDGQVWNLQVELDEMVTRACHQNSAALCENNPDYKLVTGYALSPDGLWRQHTWVVDGIIIVETTELRDMYYGVELTLKDREEFILFNQY